MNIQLQHPLKQVMGQTGGSHSTTSSRAFHHGIPSSVTFGNKFSDEIKDSKGLVKEAGKGIGLFAHLFSFGTFPLNLISSVSLELSPEKKEKLKAYTELIQVGLRPSSNHLDVERANLADQLTGMIQRNVAPPEISAWFDKGKAYVAALKGEQSLSSPAAATCSTSETPCQPAGDRASIGLPATEAWVKEGQALLANVQNPSPALGVWLHDAKRWTNRMSQWLTQEKKAHQLLDSPSPKVQEWMNTLKIAPAQLRTAVVDANQIDREAYVPPETLIRMRDLGLFRLKVPKEYGGLDFHQKEYHRVVKTLPYISGTLGVLVSAHSTIGSAPLILNGTKAQQEEYLPKMAEGNFLAAFGLTEPGAGTDTKKLKTTATLSPDGKEWIVNGESGELGEKIFITNAHRAGVMFLMAKTDLGNHFGKPGENAMISKWLFTNAQSKRNPEGKLNEFGDPVGTKYENGTPWKLDPKDRTGKSINYDYIRSKHPHKPWMKLSNKMMKESTLILDLPFRITDTPAVRRKKMDELADKGMVIAEPLDLMMIRGSNQAYIRFNNFRVPVNKVLGGMGEDTEPFLKALHDNADKPEVPGLDWRKMTLNGKPLKLGGFSQGMNDVFNALNRGRAGFGPSYAGASRGLLELSRRHAIQREMFDLYGGTQDKMPIIKKYLGDMAMKTAALDAVSELTSALIEEHGDKMNIIDVCAAIKVIATEWNWDVAQLAMRIHGGSGTRRGADHGMERNLRDAWIGIIVEGVNEAMKQVVMGVGATPALEKMQEIQRRVTFIPFSKKFYTETLTIPFEKDTWRLLKGTVPSRLSEAGALDSSDAAWIQSRAKELWRKSSAWGARYQDKMMGRQNELIRLSEIALDLYALAAVGLKLKKAEDLPHEEVVSLKGFTEVTRRRIDRNLEEFSYKSENPDDRNARHAADAHFDVERKKLAEEQKAS